MVRWICPECGGDWPGAEQDCPVCSGRLQRPERQEAAAALVETAVTDLRAERPEAPQTAEAQPAAVAIVESFLDDLWTEQPECEEPQTAEGPPWEAGGAEAASPAVPVGAEPPNIDEQDAEVETAAYGGARIVPGWVVSLVLAVALIAGLTVLVYLLVGVRRVAEGQTAPGQRSAEMRGGLTVVHLAPSNSSMAVCRNRNIPSS